MRHASLAAALFALLLGVTVSAPADAGGPRFHHKHHFGHHKFHHGGHRFHHRHGGVRIGLFIGVPTLAYWQWHHHPYPYPFSHTVVVRESPPEYIEQSSPAPAAAAPQPQQWWYYCADARMYYPYVKECPGGWMRVAPHQPQQ